MSNIYVCVCVCVCMCVCVCVCVWCVCVCVCVKMHKQRDKLEVVFRIDKRCYVVGFATGWLRKSLYLFLYIFVCMFVEVILTKKQNIIIAFRRK